MSNQTVTPRPARQFIRLFLRATGNTSICLPHFGIFILGKRMHQQELVCATGSQAQQMGVVRWAVTYLWCNLRYGYRKNPLEVEARLDMR